MVKLSPLFLEVIVGFNVVCGSHESESRMLAPPAWREYFPRYTGDFMFLGVGGIMGNTINP